MESVTQVQILDKDVWNDSLGKSMNISALLSASGK